VASPRLLGVDDRGAMCSLRQVAPHLRRTGQ